MHTDSAAAGVSRQLAELRPVALAGVAASVWPSAQPLHASVMRIFPRLDRALDGALTQ